MTKSVRVEKRNEKGMEELLVEVLRMLRHALYPGEGKNVTGVAGVKVNCFGGGF